MSTLTEIEAAVESLPQPEQEELLQHLSMRLQGRTRVADASRRTEGQGSRLGKNPRTCLPLIRCTSGVVIEPTKEELGDF